MSRGPNKIILLPDDLMFVVPKGTVFTSKVRQINSLRKSHLILFSLQVNLRNEAHERSNMSLRSGDILAGKTARYNVSEHHLGLIKRRYVLSRVIWLK